MDAYIILKEIYLSDGIISYMVSKAPSILRNSSTICFHNYSSIFIVLLCILLAIENRGTWGIYRIHQKDAC